MEVGILAIYILDSRHLNPICRVEQIKSRKSYVYKIIYIVKMLQIV